MKTPKIKNKKLPTTRATTAYGLLQAVIKAIQEEPKRLDMETMLTRPGENSWRKRIPDCGTIGCVGGWTISLGLGTPQTHELKPAFRLLLSDKDRLRKPTRIDRFGEEINRDSEIRRDLDDLFFNGFPRGNPGTKLYASHVVGRIRKFMAKHEKALKAKRIR